jgi:hypothetical protein
LELLLKMKHNAIEQVLQRAERSKSDSDFTYLFSLLLAAEAITKTIVLGITASIADDKDRNRYRLEHHERAHFSGPLIC